LSLRHPAEKVLRLRRPSGGFAQDRRRGIGAVFEVVDFLEKSY